MKLPKPREELAGCVWLPRILAKARLAKRGWLEAEYAERFCHPSGTDGQFVGFFQVTKNELLAVCEGSDEEVAAWFAARPMGSAARIAEWNRLAVNLGRAGFPMRRGCRWRWRRRTGIWRGGGWRRCLRFWRRMRRTRVQKDECALAESIVGSWRFVRSTHPDFRTDEALVYHFTSDGKNYWEVSNGDKRHLCKFGYRISADVLTLIYKDREQTHVLSRAEDGSVAFPNAAGSQTWWMVRLRAPEDDFIAFVGPDGLLRNRKGAQEEGDISAVPPGSP